LSVQKLEFEHVPAVGRVTVSSPSIMRAFVHLNDGKPYTDKINPFNFTLTCHVRPLGHPMGADAARFHLIGQYDSDSRKWLTKEWVDQYTGNSYRITTGGHHGDRSTARVKTFGEVLSEYQYHPEAKCADSDGQTCRKQTFGLLQRRHVRVERVRYIGKESNSLEEVDAGMIHAASNVYTEYRDPRRDEWETKIRPALKKVSLSRLIKATGLSRMMLIDARTGRSRPHPKNQELLLAVLRKLAVL
jgi:hypothetical protein